MVTTLIPGWVTPAKQINAAFIPSWVTTNQNEHDIDPRLRESRQKLITSLISGYGTPAKKLSRH
jgi:hypothetical protein